MNLCFHFLKGECMADRGGKRWRLEREGRVLAELVLVDVDMPWWLCRVEQVSEHGFEEVRSATIAAERAMVAGEHEEAVRLMAGIRELGLWVRLDDGGDPVDEFLLWFDEDTARLRY
jgi:hypothetical protein